MASRTSTDEAKTLLESQKEGTAHQQRPNTHAAVAENPRSPDVRKKAFSPQLSTSNSADPDHAGETLRGSFEEPGAVGRDKKKGVSFLSRFISTKKKDQHLHPSDRQAGGDRAGVINDGVSETSDVRPDGMDAHPFSQNVDNIEFNPRHPQPPEYIKVHTKHKKRKEFDRVFLAQELSFPKTLRNGSARNSADSQRSTGLADPDAIWTIKFSADGKYLAAGGQGKTLRVWEVLSSPDERRDFESQEKTRLSAPVFKERPFREYEGHDGPIIDLDWSKNNFLLSSSYDKTVRLWHVSRPECLCTFKHPEHVLSARFHPRDDRFFLAGCRDMKLRFWSIPDKAVAFSSQLPDVITAVAFTPDGKTAIAGTCGGLCLFYQTQGLKQQSQIHVRSTHGKNAKGSKVCSIEAISVDPGMHVGTKGGSGSGSSEVKLLISSADSRIRLYNLRDKQLEAKFKGHKAEELRIHASLSEDGQYIVAGSEDRAAYIWSTNPAEHDIKPGQSSFEYFDVSREKTTAVLVAPQKTKQLMISSGDPIFDLCNPPPVTLISRAESVSSSQAPTENGNGNHTQRPELLARKQAAAAENPAYLARCAHFDGNIIVAASSGGTIRVFRQDCAFMKRRASDAWETGSTFSMQRRATGALVARGFGATRASRSDSNSTQPPQDRILSWRQGIGSTTSLDRGSLRPGSAHDSKLGGDRGLGIATVKSRSISPKKNLGSLSRSSSRRRDSAAITSMSMMTGLPLVESPQRLRHAATEDLRTNGHGRSASTSTTNSAAISAIPAANMRPKFGDHGVVLPEPPRQDPTLLGAGLGRPGFSQQNSETSVESAASRLSSEVSSSPPEEEELACSKCGHVGFKAKSVKGATRLHCEKCGTKAE